MAAKFDCGAAWAHGATTVNGVQIVVHSHRIGSWTVLTTAGDLDVVGGPDLRQHVMTVIQSGESRIILDLTGVGFIDSFGLGVLIGALKRVRLADGDVRLVIPDRRVRRVLEMCDLDRVFVITDTAEDAVEADRESDPR